MNLNLETASVPELDMLLKMAVDSNNDDCIALIEDIMAELEKRGELRDLTQEEIEQGYNNCLNKIQRTEIKVSPRKRKSSKRYIAAAAVIAVSVSFTIAYAANFGFLMSVINWTKDTVQYVFGIKDSSDDDRGQYTQFYNLQFDLQNLGISINLPAWVPEDYMFESIEITNAELPKHVTAWFSNGDNFISLKVLEIADLNNSDMTEVDDDVKSYIKNGIEHFIMTNGVSDKLSKVFWVNNGFEITVQGQLTKEQLEKIIDSIYEGT